MDDMEDMENSNFKQMIEFVNLWLDISIDSFKREYFKCWVAQLEFLSWL